MNRRNLFQACAAGLAWLAGGKLPAVERQGPHPVETCECEKCNRSIRLVCRAVERDINGKWLACELYRRPDGILVSNTFYLEAASEPFHWQHPRFNEYLAESLRVF